MSQGLPNRFILRTQTLIIWIGPLLAEGMLPKVDWGGGGGALFAAKTGPQHAWVASCYSVRMLDRSVLEISIHCKYSLATSNLHAWVELVSTFKIC